MTRLIQPSPAEESAWRKWAKKLPPVAREIASRLDPWTLYRLKTTGQRVLLISIFDDGTIRVLVSGRFNLILHERTVYGINPDDLEPCAPPPPDELTGVMLSQDQVEKNIDALRVMVRPDLWIMETSGIARRKQ